MTGPSGLWAGAGNGARRGKVPATTGKRRACPDETAGLRSLLKPQSRFKSGPRLDQPAAHFTMFPPGYTNSEIPMRSMFVLLLLLAAPLAPLFADKIITNEDKTFEGIVIAFDKDKKLTLATGYGDLSFTVATEIKDAAVADFTWPKVTALSSRRRCIRMTMAPG